jgi:hypothetical protein
VLGLRIEERIEMLETLDGVRLIVPLDEDDKDGPEDGDGCGDASVWIIEGAEVLVSEETGGVDSTPTEPVPVT